MKVIRFSDNTMPHVVMPRIGFVDDWKGFMLLIVCLGHNNMSWPFLNLIMPLHVTSFFFLSGFLFKIKPNSTKKIFMRRKYYSLALPYIYLSFIFLFLNPKLYNTGLTTYEGFHPVLSYLFNIDVHSINTSIDYFLFNLGSIFIEGNSSPIVGALWFVPALFLVNLLLYLVLYFCQRKWHIITSLLIFAIIGWMLNLSRSYLPFKLEAVFSATAVALFGYLSKDIIQYLGKLSLWHSLCAIFLLFVLYIVGLNINGSISYWQNVLGPNLWGYVLTVISGMYLCALLFINIAKLGGAFLKWIAQNGLIILASHYYVIHVYNMFVYHDDIYSPYIRLLIIVLFCVLCAYVVNRWCPSLVGKK